MNWSSHKRKLSQKFWPHITDEASARKAAFQGAGAAALISVVTAILAIGGFLGFDLSLLWDATIFAIVAWGIFKMSRFAAVAGLIMYLLEQGYKVAEAGKIGNLGMLLLFCLAFVNSIRATVFYHRSLKHK